jgi:hypothetical protein
MTAIGDGHVSRETPEVLFLAIGCIISYWLCL